MDNLLAVVVGWLLGIMGQRPIIYIQQAIKKPALKRSVIAELVDIRYRLAATSYILLDRIGELDKSFLKWIHPILKSYDGYFKYLETHEHIDKMLASNDSDFENLRVYAKLHMDLTKGVTLRVFDIPLINSHISEIHLLGSEFQNRIVEVLAQIRNINNEIENAKYYFFKTFDSGLSERNVTIVKGNLETSYQNIAKMSIGAAKNISTVLAAT